MNGFSAVAGLEEFSAACNAELRDRLFRVVERVPGGHCPSPCLRDLPPDADGWQKKVGPVRVEIYPGKEVADADGFAERIERIGRGNRIALESRSSEQKAIGDAVLVLVNP